MQIAVYFCVLAFSLSTSIIIIIYPICFISRAVQWYWVYLCFTGLLLFLLTTTIAQAIVTTVYIVYIVIVGGINADLDYIVWWSLTLYQPMMHRCVMVSP